MASRDQASAGLMFIPTKARGLLLGTIIRGTLIQGPNRSQNAKRNQTIRPTTPKSSPNPPKEAQSSLSLRPTSAVRPIRGLPLTRGATSASLEASPPRPTTAHRSSASLEATPRLTELVTHLFTCPTDKSIECQPLHRRTRVGRRQAFMPHSGCDRGPIRQLRSLLRHP